MSNLATGQSKHAAKSMMKGKYDLETSTYCGTPLPPAFHAVMCRAVLASLRISCIVETASGHERPPSTLFGSTLKEIKEQKNEKEKKELLSPALPKPLGSLSDFSRLSFDLRKSLSLARIPLHAFHLDVAVAVARFAPWNVYWSAVAAVGPAVRCAVAAVSAC